MAFGITPRYTDQTPVDLSQEHTLVIGLEAAKSLNWDIGHTSPLGFNAYTKFSMSSISEEVTVKINDGKLTIKSECTGSQLVDWGKNKSNVEDFLKRFQETRTLLSPEDIAVRILELEKNLGTQGKGEVLHQPPQTARDKIKNGFSIFIPTPGYFVTPIILNINIVVFILMVISGADVMLPDTDTLLNWGANFKPLTLDGQWWRLLTSCFIHIGVFHLLMNLYALLYIGLLLEPRLEPTRFLAAYILSGIGGSVTSLVWNDFTVSAGASGAIFGMYGVFLAMLTTNLIEKSARRTLLTSILFFVGYNLMNGLKGGIDNGAHIGGLVSGLGIGYAYFPSLVKPTDLRLRRLTVALLTVLTITITVIVYLQTPNDIGQYQKKMKEFAALEEKALEVYRKDGSTPDKELLEIIKPGGIQYWNESIKVIKEADQLYLPNDLYHRNRILVKYCEFRIESYELLYKAIDEDTDEYRGEIEACSTKIDSLLKELKSAL